MMYIKGLTFELVALCLNEGMYITGDAVVEKLKLKLDLWNPERQYEVHSLLLCLENNCVCKSRPVKNQYGLGPRVGCFKMEYCIYPGQIGRLKRLDDLIADA